MQRNSNKTIKRSQDVVEPNEITWCGALKIQYELLLLCEQVRLSVLLHVRGFFS